MQRLLCAVITVVWLSACASLSQHLGEACFAGASARAHSASPGPDWLRLAGWPAADSGAADFGSVVEVDGVGRWWRLAPDSMRVEAWGSFETVSLRAAARGDTLRGRVRYTTDGFRDSAGVRVPDGYTGEWAGRRASCRGLPAR